jgi:Na+/proline symporter
MRTVVLVFTAMVTLFALNTEASIYKMVENAYKVTLVAAIVPLAFGLYWHRSTSLGAMLAIVLGLATWINLEIINPNGLVPPQLAGLGMSLAGMIVGSLVSFAGGQKAERAAWFARR